MSASRRLTTDDGDRSLVICPRCRQAARVDRHGDRLAVTCFGGCQEASVLEALDVDRILTELAPPARANGRASLRRPAAELADDRAEVLSEPAKLRWLDVARMAQEEPPPIPWVVEDLVVRGALTALVAKFGEGKSLLSAALAAGVASGTNEAGLICHRGPVLLIDAENGEHEIHRRVRALGVPAEGIEVYEADEGFDLRHDLDQLEALLAKHHPALLVLDSFRSLWRGEENDSREVSAVLDPLRNLVRRHNAGTLLLHHAGKGGGYRGSSAIGASVELAFTLGRAGEDPNRARRFLECFKSRPAPNPRTRWLELVVERGQVYVDEAESFGEDEVAPEAPVHRELRPQVLAALGDQPRSRADIARAVGRNPKDRSVGRVLEALAGDGEAKRSEAGWQGGKVATPLGGRHPATPPVNPHSNGDYGGGRGGGTRDGPATPSERAATAAEEAEVERARGKFTVLGGGGA